LFEYWDYFTIVGIVVQLIGFIVLLSRVVERIRGLLHMFDFLLRLLDAKWYNEILLIPESKLTSAREDKFIRKWESSGISMVIIGTLLQLISFVVSKILTK
jgi:hypothetical protein